MNSYSQCPSNISHIQEGFEGYRGSPTDFNHVNDRDHDDM